MIDCKKYPLLVCDVEMNFKKTAILFDSLFNSYFWIVFFYSNNKIILIRFSFYFSC